jgi:hypothetical protein
LGEILPLGQLYRDRADCKNAFDELKNHWGWGGFTTQDLKRCRLLAASVALIYNWWSLFVRLADPDQHREVITSRPVLLEDFGVGDFSIELWANFATVPGRRPCSCRSHLYRERRWTGLPK